MARVRVRRQKEKEGYKCNTNGREGRAGCEEKIIYKEEEREGCVQIRKIMGKRKKAECRKEQKEKEEKD